MDCKIVEEGLVDLGLDDGYLDYDSCDVVGDCSFPALALAPVRVRVRVYREVLIHVADVRLG